MSVPLRIALIENAVYMKEEHFFMKKSLTGIVCLLALITGALSSCTPTTFNNEKLIIGLECDYAPFNWMEPNENEHTLKVANKNIYADGYDIQMAKILGNKLGIEVEIHQIEWGSLIPELQFGTINAVIAGMTDTAERRMTIDFTNEYYRSELVLIVPENVASQYTNALTPTEFGTLINDKPVVSQADTVTDDVIEIFENEYGAIHANPVASFSLAALDVISGSAFAMTAELPVAKSITSSLEGLGIIHIDQSILGDAQSELGVSIGIAKGNTELCDRLNTALAEISQQERNRLMEEAVSRSHEE